MEVTGRNLLIGLAVMSLMCAALIFPRKACTQSADELVMHRNLGQAYYENQEFDKAAEEFRQCIRIVPNSALDRINLAVTLLRDRHHEEAIKEFEEAKRIDPGHLHIYYGLGIAHKREGRFQKAAEYLEKVKKSDPRSAATRYNLAFVYKKMAEDEKAIEEFREVVNADPDHASAHYHLSTYARSKGREEDAKRELEIFNRLRRAKPQAQMTPEALEKSEYSDVIESSSWEKAPGNIGRTGDVRFVDVTSASKLRRTVKEERLPKTIIEASEYSREFAEEHLVPQVGYAAVFGDYDGDGYLDIYVVRCGDANILYRNSGDGTFVDAALEAGVGDRGAGTDAVFGDYDNNGHLDLYVVNSGPNVLYRNNGDGTFTDVTREAGVGDVRFGMKAVFLDYEHDSDLDIYLVNYCNLDAIPPKTPFSFPSDFEGQRNVLYRNNGDGSFTDVTEISGLSGGISRSRDVFFSDFDDDNDIDIYLVNDGSPSVLFSNLRGGRFEAFDEPAGEERGLGGEGGDFNNDGYMDVFLVTRDECVMYQNEGGGIFGKMDLPVLAGMGTSRSGPVEALDFNNDGLMDLLIVGTARRSLHLFVNEGYGRFRDVSSLLGATEKEWTRIASLCSGDYDRDGDMDILALTENGNPLLLNNEGGSANNWVEIQADGIKTNKRGTGAKVEIKVGHFYQRKTMGTPPLHFGLRDIENVDIIRITWPNGVVQNEINSPANQVMEIREKVRINASCAFLYTYDGSRFVFINEILGIGPLGVPIAEGVYHIPDCDEYIKIEGHQLKEEGGSYDIRITEELREIMFADQITLLVVDHPSEVDVYPNEMFTAPPFPEHKIYLVKDPQLPVSAYDHRGNNVLPLIQEADRTYPTFDLLSYEGLSELHWLTLDLGDLSEAKQMMLYLTGWIYWSDSSVAVAISQHGQIEPIGPYLQVRDQQGGWVTVLDHIGLPTSKGITVPVDLTGKFLTDDYEVRIVTNLCLYWDQIFLATDDEPGSFEVTELSPMKADLHFRGFSEFTRDSLGFEWFDYHKVQSKGAWGQHRGRYTRYGDVLELLMAPDDKYVIVGVGDELSLQFDATKVSPLREGWSRDFLFYANGWVKDGDLNTKHSLTVEPLPFHGMSGYPYGQDESYPYDADGMAYIEKYNTRREADTVGKL